MYLIAESGSTKCDWMLVDKEGNYMDLYKTMGYNPFFHSTTFIINDLRTHKDLMHIAPKVERLYFYGAGCESEILNSNIKEALLNCFEKAAVVVDHDLKAAAFATYDGQPCIACIIGTGSNSCYFDGEEVTEAVPALAYILGDEASGSYLGKKLLAAYLYKKLPKEIAYDFEKEFGLTKEIIFERVYDQPYANVYLAGFTRFIGQHKQHPFMQDIILKGMREFIENHVCCYENYQQLPVHFVGSIAFHFQDELRAVAHEFGINITKIIKEPIKNLVDYHVKYKFQYAIA
jgi:N-acetylglucosamine kinase-like BadF-type ATPase